MIRVAAEADEISVADLVRDVALALHDGDSARAASLVSDLHPRDLADVIELLSPEHRVALIQALGSAFDYEVLSEIDEAVRDQLSEALPNDLLARAVTELDTDDAAYLIENLEEADREEILAQLPKGERAVLERQLEYPEDPAGRLMQSDFVAVAPYWTIGQVIAHARETDDLPDQFYEIFVVDPAFRVLGSVDLSRLLRTKREVPISEIMETDLDVVLATADQEEVAREFERYNLLSAPVVDENNKLVGVITIDDIVDIIQDEADEDMLALGGVGDESLAGSVAETSRSRRAVADGEFAHRCAGLIRDQGVRRDHRADGGARSADADRGVHRRQRRDADHDGDRSRARDQQAGRGQRAAHHLARSAGGDHQRHGAVVDHGDIRVLLVRLRARSGPSSGRPWWSICWRRRWRAFSYRWRSIG